MSNDRNDPATVAALLEQAIKPPSDHALSISTFFRPGKPLAIKVFLLPEYDYLRSRIPSSLGGYEIFYELAPGVTAH